MNFWIIHTQSLTSFIAVWAPSGGMPNQFRKESIDIRSGTLSESKHQKRNRYKSSVIELTKSGRPSLLTLLYFTAKFVMIGMSNRSMLYPARIGFSLVDLVLSLVSYFSMKEMNDSKT